MADQGYNEDEGAGNKHGGSGGTNDGGRGGLGGATRGFLNGGHGRALAWGARGYVRGGRGGGNGGPPRGSSGFGGLGGATRGFPNGGRERAPVWGGRGILRGGRGGGNVGASSDASSKSGSGRGGSVSRAVIDRGRGGFNVRGLTRQSGVVKHSQPAKSQQTSVAPKDIEAHVQQIDTTTTHMEPTRKTGLGPAQASHSQGIRDNWMPYYIGHGNGADISRHGHEAAKAGMFGQALYIIMPRGGPEKNDRDYSHRAALLEAGESEKELRAMSVSGARRGRFSAGPGLPTRRRENVPAPAVADYRAKCGNCGGPHHLRRCVKVDKDGVVSGCVYHNMPGHQTDECQSVTEEQREMMLFRAYIKSRAGYPPLRAVSYDWLFEAAKDIEDEDDERNGSYGYPMLPHEVEAWVKEHPDDWKDWYGTYPILVLEERCLKTRKDCKDALANRVAVEQEHFAGSTIRQLYLYRDYQ